MSRHHKPFPAFLVENAIDSVIGKIKFRLFIRWKGGRVSFTEWEYNGTKVRAEARRHQKDKSVVSVEVQRMKPPPKRVKLLG